MTLAGFELDGTVGVGEVSRHEQGAEFGVGFAERRHVRYLLLILYS